MNLEEFCEGMFKECKSDLSYIDWSKKNKESLKRLYTAFLNEGDELDDRDIIVHEFCNMCEMLGKRNIDPGYANYMFLCLSGKFLIDDVGVDRFDEIVKQIKEIAEKEV